jgi:hypothetical protein
MKPVLLRSFWLLVFWGAVPLSCCRQATREYTYLKGLDLQLTDAAGTPLTSGARTSAAELRAMLHFQLDYIAAQQPLGAPFAGQALALQCADEGTKGLKSAVTEVVLTSTGLFNGQAAGQSLNAFVRCSVAGSATAFPLSQLVDSLNTKTGQLTPFDAPLVLHIGPKPSNNARQQFQVRVRLADASERTQRTPDIVWN